MLQATMSESDETIEYLMEENNGAGSKDNNKETDQSLSPTPPPLQDTGKGADRNLLEEEEDLLKGELSTKWLCKGEGHQE